MTERPVAAAPPPLERHEVELDDGTRRWFLLSRPEAVTEPCPLVIDLHGFGEGAVVHAETSGLAAFGRSRGFTVAVPDGTPIGHATIPQWATTVDDNPDVAFVAQLIDHLVGCGEADPGRIHLAGFSNGALLTGIALCHLSDRIAGAALVAGARLPRSRYPASPVPILVIHGTDDPVVPAAGGPVRAAAFRTDDDLVAASRTAAVDESSVEDLRRLDARPLVDLVGDHAAAQGLALVDTRRLGHELTRFVWADEEGCEVHLCVIDGGGHHWPGSTAYLGLEAILGPPCLDVDANELIWAFFRSRPARRGTTG